MVTEAAPKIDERQFWDTRRRALLMEIHAIEKRWSYPTVTVTLKRKDAQRLGYSKNDG